MDFEAEAPAGDIAAALLQELADTTRMVETGYRQGRRKTLAATVAPFTEQGPAIRNRCRFSCAGHRRARAITADVSVEMARRFRPS